MTLEHTWNAPIPGVGSLRELLTLERIDRDLYRGGLTFAEEFPLYGGQVAAQALMAAGSTVDADRQAHSLHGYFLRAGSPSVPTIFHVDRDRDGRSFSARRVVAVQDGEVIFSMSASFHRAEEGFAAQDDGLPADLPAADRCASLQLPRLFGFEAREVPQPYEELEMPVRFWTRSREQLGADPLTQAAALTYMSDIFTGLAPHYSELHKAGSSLDHAMWFHRSGDVHQWMLVDSRPHSVAGGRGFYTASIYAGGGQLLASVAQEALFRGGPSKRPVI